MKENNGGNSHLVSTWNFNSLRYRQCRLVEVTLTSVSSTLCILFTMRPLRGGKTRKYWMWLQERKPTPCGFMRHSKLIKNKSFNCKTFQCETETRYELKACWLTYKYNSRQVVPHCRQTPAVVGCPYRAGQLLVGMNSILTSSYLISVKWIRDAVFISDCKLLNFGMKRN